MNTAKIYDRIHSRRELREQPLDSSWASNRIYLDALGHVLPVSQCNKLSLLSAALRPEENL